MLNINTILGLYEYTWGIMKKNSLKKYLLITTTLLFILNVNIIQSQAYMGNETSSYNQESIEKKEFKVYFVIGIGSYFPYQGTWPAIHEISPILLCQIALRVPLISAHCIRSNGWHVHLPPVGSTLSAQVI